MTQPLYIPVIFGLSMEVYIIAIIIAIPVFIIWHLLLKKFMKLGRTRKVATWIATILTTPLVYIALIGVFVFSITYYPTHKFDQGKWLANQEKRYEYTDDIIESKMLIGKSKQQVWQLLGEGGNVYINDYWGYYIGFKPGLFSIDPFELVIEFKNGKVVKVSQRET